MLEIGTENGRRQVELPPREPRGIAGIERRLGEDYVVLHNPVMEPVDPRERRRLVEDLAALDDPRSVLDFVARWGMLSPTPELPDEARNPPDPEALRWTEPVSAYRSVAARFGLVLGFYAAIRDVAPDEAVAALETIRPRGLPAEQRERYPKTLDEAATLIAEVVSSGLEGVEEQLVPGAAAGDARARFALAGRASSLRQYAYHALADLLADGPPVAECANPACRRVFEVRHRKRLYHDENCKKRHHYAIEKERHQR